MTVPASEAAEALPGRGAVAEGMPTALIRISRKASPGTSTTSPLPSAMGWSTYCTWNEGRPPPGNCQTTRSYPVCRPTRTTPIAPRSPPRSGYLGELTASSEKPAGADAVPVGDALLVGDGVPVVADVVGLGEEVGAVDVDRVGVGVGGSSSEQPPSASDMTDSTVTVPTMRNLFMRDLPLMTVPAPAHRPG